MVVWDRGGDQAQCVPQGPLISFLDKTSSWLETYGTPVTIPRLKSVSAWLVQLPDGPSLQVFREPVQPGAPSCDQCRIMKWGAHPVSAVRYHFIIPAEAGEGSLCDPTSLVSAVASAALRGRSKGTVPLFLGAADGLASPPGAPVVSPFEQATHLLHGMVHGSGYGHLLRVNGKGPGNSTLGGRAIVELWSELCRQLNVVAVSTEDVSSKSGMDLRVLHTVASGQTWYGNFGYGFGRGAYNISHEQWSEAAQELKDLPLSSLLEARRAGDDSSAADVISLDQAIGNIILRYSMPAVSASCNHRLPKPPASFGDLLRRLLDMCLPTSDARAFFDREALHTARTRIQAAVAARDKRKKEAPAITRGKRKVSNPEVGSEVRIYIRQRRTYYKVQIEAARPAPALRDHSSSSPGTEEHLIRYRSGQEEWLDLSEVPWSYTHTVRKVQVTRRPEPKPMAVCIEQQLKNLPDPKLGCPKCRHSKSGCAVCRQRLLSRLEDCPEVRKKILSTLRSCKHCGAQRKKKDKKTEFRGCHRCWSSVGDWLGELMQPPGATARKRSPDEEDAMEYDGEATSPQASSDEEEIPWVASFLDESSFEALLPPDEVDQKSTDGSTIEPATAVTPTGKSLPQGSPAQRRQHQMTNPLPVWHGMVAGSAPRAAADEVTVARLQCQCDLAHVYERLLSKAFTERILRGIKKNEGVNAVDGMDARNNTGQSSLLYRMAIAVRRLRDCKMFVNHVWKCWSGPPHGYTRLLCSIPLPPNFELQLPKNRQGFKRRPGRKSVGAKVFDPGTPAPSRPANNTTLDAELPRAQAAIPPPPMALDLPLDTDLGSTAIAFTRAFADAYVVLRNFIPMLLLPYDGAKGWRGIEQATDATILAPLLEQVPADNGRAFLPGLPCLTLAGRGLDRSPAWWREGGQEDWVVDCSCGTNDDDGERMLVCDGCHTWHHWRCAGLDECAELPPSWSCATCGARESTKNNVS